MSGTFSSPDEYLAYLQREYARQYPPGTPDSEFTRITAEQFERHKINPNTWGPFGSLGHIVGELKKNVLESLASGDRKEIESHVGIGLLPDGEANAFIARSPNGHFALVLSSGLMLLLHKYFKLVRAFINPQDVVHCNRKTASELTQEDLDSYIIDLIDLYTEKGAPYGPMLKLNDEASAQQSLMLHCAELFVLCHELGHYFNGDLNDKSSYFSLPRGMAGDRYAENQNHEQEFRADVAGFQLYSRCLELQGTNLKSVELLKPVLATFNLLYAIGGGASSTHPHPYDRATRIAKEHYGDAFGKQIAEALANPNLLPALWKAHS